LRSNFLVFCLIFLCSCKTYYDSTKIYFDNENELIQKSLGLVIKVPLRINFSGNVNDNLKDYKVNGFIKIESGEHYQIFLFSKTYGIEICRLDINKDKITFIDKLNRNFYKGKLSNFRYLRNSNILGEQYLQLMLGRIFSDINLIKTNELNKYSYDLLGIKGDLKFYSYGFVKEHKLLADNILIDLNFDKYSVKSDIPAILKGNVKLKEINLKIDLLLTSGNSSNITLEDFIVPNSYTEIL